MADHEDTIAALATPVGEGGISIVRVSGGNAIPVVDELFVGRHRVLDMKSHTVAFGNLVDRRGAGKRIIDEVVVIVFRNPNSYTGEDVVEIHCHGGMYVSRSVLDVLFDSGIRHANPGEFTLRAFLNGRMDLSQAEAVADIIHARSETAHRSSVDQLKGSLSVEIQKIRSDLLNFCSMIELELDFSEEGLELVNRDSFFKRAEAVVHRLCELIESFSLGRIHRDGIKVVLAGRPNAGKSSLLNALLRENRAIVTEIPGTTRDTIEENLQIDGLLFRIIDTAGLRETSDPIESEGVQRTLDQLERSDMTLLIVDLSVALTEETAHFMEDLLKDMKRRDVLPIVVFNKIDLVDRETTQSSGHLMHYPFVKLSAKTGEGIDGLRSIMVRTATGGKSMQEGSVLVTNSRHRDALVRAQRSLKMAIETLKRGESGEFISVDLRASLDALGEITGEVTSEDILNNIFSQFCIGK